MSDNTPTPKPVIPKPVIQLPVARSVIPSTIAKPVVTPIVPSPIIKPNILVPITPVIPSRTIKPTVPSPKIMTVPIPKPVMTVPTRSPTIARPPSPKIVFTPEMIDEATIVDYASKLSKDNLIGLLAFLDENYYGGEGLISDSTYNKITNIYDSKYGKYLEVRTAPTREKVAHKYYISSLDKIKEEKEIIRYAQAHMGPYVIMDKVDGITIILEANNGQIRLSTHGRQGTGFEGIDVSHLVQYMNLPTINIDIDIRGELVLTKETFQRVAEFQQIDPKKKSARNILSGNVMAKKHFKPEIAIESSFYAFRILSESNTPSEDMTKLQKLGFLVPHPIIVDEINKDMLETYFIERKEQAEYEMDGLVIYQNQAIEYSFGELPKHVIAFKTDIG